MNTLLTEFIYISTWYYVETNDYCRQSAFKNMNENISNYDFDLTLTNWSNFMIK